MAVNSSRVSAGNRGIESRGGGGEVGAATTRERIAYLRGLLQGCDFTSAGTGAGQRQLWDGLLEVVDGLVRDSDALRASMEEQDEYIDAMDEALWSVEERLDTDDDDIVVEFDDGDIAVECPNCGEAFALEPESISAEGETRCPECGKAVTLQSITSDGELSAVLSHPSIPTSFQDDHIGNGNSQYPHMPS